MPAKKYSVEQIVAKLREHEKLQGQGTNHPVRPLDPVYRWRLKYGGGQVFSYGNAGAKRCEMVVLGSTP